MSDLDVVYSKISIIKNCLNAIERVKKEQTDEFFRQGLFELNLQRAIQACIDLANVIISREGFELPNSYRQSFEILNRNKVIDSKLTKSLVSMIGFRNISVHDYDEINPKIVESIISNHLVDFEKFYEIIYGFSQSRWK